MLSMSTSTSSHKMSPSRMNSWRLSSLSRPAWGQIVTGEQELAVLQLRLAGEVVQVPDQGSQKHPVAVGDLAIFPQRVR